jgi:hypothetical protein
MPLPAIPDTAFAMISRLLITTTVAALSSTCGTVRKSLRPTIISHQTSLPSQVWWRLTCHMRIPTVGQLAATCLGISKLLRQMLISDYWPTAAPLWRTQEPIFIRPRCWSRGTPTRPLPPVFLRPRGPSSTWPDSFLPDGFPRNPHAPMVWAGQPWRWTQAQRQQWEDTADAQSESYCSSPGHPPAMTPRHGFLTHTQFSWHITGISFNYARDRFCADDLPSSSEGDSDNSDNSRTDRTPTHWHIRQDRSARYHAGPDL